jgi:hypothetical protein
MDLIITNYWSKWLGEGAYITAARISGLLKVRYRYRGFLFDQLLSKAVPPSSSSPSNASSQIKHHGTFA